MSRTFIIFAAVLAVTATAGKKALAELLSSRPITVINPFTPGASSDTLQRIVNKKVSEDTGQTLSPAKSVSDLVALAKSKPGGLSFASQGTGSGGHLLGEMFKLRTGANMVHVPYRGAAPA